ncbi:MAG: CoA transferase, partial [Aliifodinibius sp.]|nr:CoA transferase [Fodinibius sp.]
GFNLPVPLASSRLTELGAQVIKIEPPNGDPFKKFCPQWYEEIILGQEVYQVNLKSNPGKAKLHKFLEE